MPYLSENVAFFNFFHSDAQMSSVGMCDFPAVIINHYFVIRKLVLPLFMLDPSLTNNGFAFATVNGIFYLHLR